MMAMASADINDPDCQCHFTVNGNLLQNASLNLLRIARELFILQRIGYCHCLEMENLTLISMKHFYLHNPASCAYDSERVMHYMPPALPLPDGTGFISIEKDAYSDLNIPNMIRSEPLGQCLYAALKAGEDYTLSFYAAGSGHGIIFLEIFSPFTGSIW